MSIAVHFRPGRVAGVVSLLTLTGIALLGAGTASAAPDSAAPDSSTPATIRAAHLSPDMPGVDIYITSFSGTTSTYLADATYGDVGRYVPVPAGSYTFSVRRHGAAMSAPALQTWSLTARPGYAYTAAEVGTGRAHRGVVFNDDLTPPTRGHGNVRLIQAASRAGNAAEVVAAAGPVVARNAAFGTSTGYASIEAGTWVLRASGEGEATDRSVSIRAGSVTSVILLDAPSGGIRIIDTVDAAAAPTAPKGSVDAGRALARPASTDTGRGLPVLVAALLGLPVLLCVAVRRRLMSASRS